jgi:catechol 2,3-dioxygenase-like lactoylglutathione lyase family enzyme
MRLHHVALACSSQENAERFYGGVLGLRKIKASPLSEALAERIFDIAQECQITFYANETLSVEVFVPSSPVRAAPSFAHLCLEVENREGFIGKCREMGLSVNLIPKGQSQLTFVRDYDGNLFEIKGT